MSDLQHPKEKHTEWMERRLNTQMSDKAAKIPKKKYPVVRCEGVVYCLTEDWMPPNVSGGLVWPENNPVDTAIFGVLARCPDLGFFRLRKVGVSDPDDPDYEYITFVFSNPPIPGNTTVDGYIKSMKFIGLRILPDHFKGAVTLSVGKATPEELDKLLHIIEKAYAMNTALQADINRDERVSQLESELALKDNEWNERLRRNLNAQAVEKNTVIEKLEREIKAYGEMVDNLKEQLNCFKNEGASVVAAPAPEYTDLQRMEFFVSDFKGLIFNMPKSSLMPKNFLYDLVALFTELKEKFNTEKVNAEIKDLLEYKENDSN